MGNKNVILDYNYIHLITLCLLNILILYNKCIINITYVTVLT